MASNPTCKGETEAVIDFPLHTDHGLGLESSLSGACGLEAHLKPYTHTHRAAIPQPKIHAMCCRETGQPQTLLSYECRLTGPVGWTQGRARKGVGI